MWLVFSLVSGGFYTIQGLITRRVLKGSKDAWAFSFFFSAVGALISFPFFLTNMRIPATYPFWLLIILVSYFIVFQNFLNFKSTNYLPASVGGAMTKFRLVWVFVLGVIILKEAFTWQKTLGTLFAVLAGVIIFKKGGKLGSIKGLALVFVSTVFYAIVIILYKNLFNALIHKVLLFLFSYFRLLSMYV